MEFNLSDSEIEIMKIIWEHVEIRAAEIADIAKAAHDWERNTTYTFLKRLIQKGAVARKDPGFICSALCDRKVHLRDEANDVIDRLFDGSLELFVASFLNSRPITEKEKEKLQKLINNAD